MNIPNINYLTAKVLLTTLAARGAKHVVISPGSRSTPLAHTAICMSEFQCYVLIDERSAAFFALGLAKAERVPAILICTSGTAAANYFPAMIEASQSYTPLIALTADRPISLRNTGAPQTIDQHRLYGNSVRMFAELPPASLSIPVLRGIRDTAEIAYQLATGDLAGAVHINVPFDEPLAPINEHSEQLQELWDQLSHDKTFPKKVSAATNLDLSIAELIANSQSGLIVAGPGAAHTADERDSIYRLARQLGWPLFADVLSGLRFCGEPVIPFYDLFLRNDDLAGLAPDCVIAFGAFPTSKPLNAYLDRHRSAFTVRVQPHTLTQDPTRRATKTIIAETSAWCTLLREHISAMRDSWLLDPFQKCANAIRSALPESTLQGDHEAELAYVASAFSALPADASIILANSMSVRYADSLFAFDGRALTCYGMRGANGIDGTLSHAAGISNTSEHALLITGDLAFLHDLGGLLAVKRYAKSLDILLLNNNGGGIFNFLPVAESSEHFEQTHGTPHHLNLGAAAELFGIEWIQVDSPQHIGSLLRYPRATPRVFEILTDRASNRERQQFWMEHLSTL